ncbi:hypothetical protein N0V83_000764 [Neocucurbitaria cava]|uniref:Uncharacterized protein n=1 Tax=Neocucurbitaria cava TaxID=798079 RepID=A0A9W9CSF7_9PLEO|nr:hypothetical protein N0V83_000764 [Neocucurbitaria cava]
MSDAQEHARARAQSAHEARLAPIPEDFVPDAVAGDSYNDQDEEEATSEDHGRSGHTLMRDLAANLSTAVTASVPFPTVLRSPMDARSRSQSAPSTFGTFERAQDANWFATATPTSFFGFPPVTQQLAMNNTPEATRSFPDNESTAVPWHSKVFEDAYRPLLPGENFFEVVDPVKDRRRFANYIYGFIPNPGTGGRAAPSWNEYQEQVSELQMRDIGVSEPRPYGNSRGGWESRTSSPSWQGRHSRRSWSG